jgi:hypothetical protein
MTMTDRDEDYRRRRRIAYQNGIAPDQVPSPEQERQRVTNAEAADLAVIRAASGELEARRADTEAALAELERRQLLAQAEEANWRELAAQHADLRRARSIWDG